MVKAGNQAGTSTLEVVASLILVTFAAAGLAVVLPMAYGRVAVWQGQANVSRHLEQHLESLRATQYNGIPSGENMVTEDGYSCRSLTREVKESADTLSWIEAGTASGNGLAAEYYSNVDFTGTRVGRIDANVNFNWGNAAPVTGIGAGGFSVRWTGWVEGPTTGNYIFTIQSDDGARLWVNGQLVINHWDTAGSGNSAALGLTARQRVPVKMEYHAVNKKANAYLLWSGPSLSQQVIPSRYLYSSLAKLTTVTVSNSLVGQSGRMVSFQDEADWSTVQKTMGVADIAMSRVYYSFPFDAVVVRVKVCDANGAPLAGVTVKGVLDTWFSTWNLSAVTGSDGIAVMNEMTFLMSATFTVSTLVKEGYTYQSNLNVETSDSISVF